MLDLDLSWHNNVDVVHRTLRGLASNEIQCDLQKVADLLRFNACGANWVVEPAIAEPWQLAVMDALADQGIQVLLQDQINLAYTHAELHKMWFCIGTVLVNEESTFFCAMHNDCGCGVFLVNGLERNEIDATDELCMQRSLSDCAERMFADVAARCSGKAAVKLG